MPMVCLKDDCFCSRESCDEYDICKERKLQEQTNEEWIQTCTTEQLAVFLEGIINSCYSCFSFAKSKGCAFGECECNVREWLKQPHTKEE